jgi:hypothetical protein
MTLDARALQKSRLPDFPEDMIVMETQRLSCPFYGHAGAGMA